MEDEKNLGSETTPETPAGQSIEQPAVEAQESEQTSPDAPQADVETSETPSSPESPPAQQMDVDEMGVPYKNRYMESQRKLDKLSEQLNAVTEKIDASQGQKRGEYSIEELEAFIDSSDNQSHKIWAKSEIRRLQKEEVAKGIRTEIQNWQAAQQAEQTRNNAFQTVMQRHPEAFKKNAQGQFIGWDDKSPLAQRIAVHMQDPEIKNNPRGLLVAAALAYSDVAQNATAHAKAKTTQAKAEVKNLQKKTLTEGGGVSSPPQSKTPAQASRERLASTGSIKDGAVAMKEILKSRGRIKEG